MTKFIRIGIADKNDNPPYFDKNLYEAEVDENEDIQHTVLTVTAKDHDECKYFNRNRRIFCFFFIIIILLSILCARKIQLIYKYVIFRIDFCVCVSLNNILFVLIFPAKQHSALYIIDGNTIPAYFQLNPPNMYEFMYIMILLFS